MGETVLDRVHRLADAYVIGGQRSIDATAEGQVQGQGSPLREVGPARSVQSVERLEDPPANERVATGDRCRRTAGFLVIRTAQAMFTLVAGVTVNRGEDGEIVLTVPLEVVVAHADEQCRTCEVLHVVIGSKLEIVDERPLVIGSRSGRRNLQRGARVA